MLGFIIVFKLQMPRDISLRNCGNEATFLGLQKIVQRDEALLKRAEQNDFPFWFILQVFISYIYIPQPSHICHVSKVEQNSVK